MLQQTLMNSWAEMVTAFGTYEAHVMCVVFTMLLILVVNHFRGETKDFSDEDDDDEVLTAVTLKEAVPTGDQSPTSDCSPPPTQTPQDSPMKVSQQIGKLNHAPKATYRLTADYNTARGKVLDGTSQPKQASVRKARQWENGKKHGVEDGSLHHKIMMLLKSSGGHATFAEIDSAFPTVSSEYLKDCLREMKNQGIIRQ
jgi:hypothetical protein